MKTGVWAPGYQTHGATIIKNNVMLGIEWIIKEYEKIYFRRKNNNIKKLLKKIYNIEQNIIILPGLKAQLKELKGGGGGGTSSSSSSSSLGESKTRNDL